MRAECDTVVAEPRLTRWPRPMAAECPLRHAGCCNVGVMTPVSRSTALFLAALALTNCSGGDSVAPGESEAPDGGDGGSAEPGKTPANVVFILTDDLAWNLVE